MPETIFSCRSCNVCYDTLESKKEPQQNAVVGLKMNLCREIKKVF